MCFSFKETNKYSSFKKKEERENPVRTGVLCAIVKEAHT